MSVRVPASDSLKPYEPYRPASHEEKDLPPQVTVEFGDGLTPASVFNTNRSSDYSTMQKEGKARTGMDCSSIAGVHPVALEVRGASGNGDRYGYTM